MECPDESTKEGHVNTNLEIGGTIWNGGGTIWNDGGRFGNGDGRFGLMVQDLGGRWKIWKWRKDLEMSMAHLD